MTTLNSQADILTVEAVEVNSCRGQLAPRGEIVAEENLLAAGESPQSVLRVEKSVPQGSDTDEDAVVKALDDTEDHVDVMDVKVC